MKNWPINEFLKMATNKSYVIKLGTSKSYSRLGLILTLTDEQITLFLPFQSLAIWGLAGVMIY
jgi:hypothetical protein